MSIQEHGPAFPVSDLSKTQCPGMDLRDYFASLALSSLDWDDYVQMSEAAKQCYRMADEMLKARECAKQ